ncbi:MAG TPA: GAF domain-containing sensor histidine kinase [Vicinamibacterales bacterium]|nr:GAF domain-containing sensor histidine kinase [Vicinamibacterales bacterium]
MSPKKKVARRPPAFPVRRPSRSASQTQLRRRNDVLQRRVADRTRWLTLLHETSMAVTGAASANEALQEILQRICETEQWQVGCVYLPGRRGAEELTTSVTCVADERFGPFQEISNRSRFKRSQSLPGRVYAEERSVWIDDPRELRQALVVRGHIARQLGLNAAATLPVRADHRVIGVLELFSDQPHPRSDELVALLDDVGAQIGRALERERLMGEVTEMVWREQQDLVHALHDSLGQELTGIGLLSASLSKRCRNTQPAEAETAQRIVEGAQRALDCVHQLSRGLFLLDLEAGGLFGALQQLAAATEHVYKVACRVRGDALVAATNGHAATQLYRIAQEGVTNALRHAGPCTVSIEVRRDGDGLVLSVADDGIGIDSAASSKEGMGLRIMRYRAMTIGATLTIAPRPGGGTLVTCRLHESAPAGA